MSHHDRKPVLTMANAPPIIAAFLAGARCYDVDFKIEEGEGEVTVWLQDKPQARVIMNRLAVYLEALVHVGVRLQVRLGEVAVAP